MFIAAILLLRFSSYFWNFQQWNNTAFLLVSLALEGKTAY